MPNHTYNKLEINGTVADVRRLKEAIEGEDGPIDFNKIVPMPEFIDRVCKGHNTIDGEKVTHWIDEGGKARKLTPEEQTIVDEHGDWYDWSVRNWGTKWNAYGQSVIEHDEEEKYDYASLVIQFDTAWSPPEPVISALQEQYPDLEISGYYVGEGNEFAGVF